MSPHASFRIKCVFSFFLIFISSLAAYAVDQETIIEDEVGEAHEAFHNLESGRKIMTITRVAVVTPASPWLITTDKDKITVPYKPTNLSLDLDVGHGQATLSPIGFDDYFRLPPLIGYPEEDWTDWTIITSKDGAKGTCDKYGTLTFPEMNVHLNSQYEADLTLNLTTEIVNLSPKISEDSLSAAGFYSGGSSRSARGSRIASNGYFVLVGGGVFKNVEVVKDTAHAFDVASLLKNASVAIMVEGAIK